VNLPAEVRRYLPKRPRLEFPLAAPSVPASVDPPPGKATTGVDYDTSWARNFPARVTRAALLDNLLQPTVRLLAKPERRGLDRLADLQAAWRDEDRLQPLILAANHHSHLDSALIITSLPEPWRHKVFVGAAADYFFTNHLSSAASALALNAIPIEREGVSRRSVGQAEALLADGWSLILFPEGGRSPDGWGQPHKPGAAWLAQRSGAPVVPIHIAGTGRILPKGAKKLTPGRTIVTFGSPLWCADADHPDEEARAFAARIEAAVDGLADEAAGDWYGARRRRHDGRTPALAGPQLASWRRAWALGDRKGRPTPVKRAWPDLG
jgi:1-acyl-sn-glycerol-3-phosphate acyltransferase